jgi:DNA (cytosine-5)-methyltransferase 1
VENEIAACATLVKAIENEWLDDAPIWDDVKTFDAEPWRGRVSAIIGGYPCQPFSNAGPRNSVRDPRHLWPYIEALIVELQPSFCFFENVASHLKRGYYDAVRPAFEAHGYAVTEGLFSAEEVGAPHERERLFILAYSRKSRLEERHVQEVERAWQNIVARPTRWGAEPDISRVDDGSPFRRDEIHQSGNAVIPVVAAKAFCTLSREFTGGILSA